MWSAYNRRGVVRPNRLLFIVYSASHHIFIFFCHHIDASLDRPTDRLALVGLVVVYVVVFAAAASTQHYCNRNTIEMISTLVWFAWMRPGVFSLSFSICVIKITKCAWRRRHENEDKSSMRLSISVCLTEAKRCHTVSKVLEYVVIVYAQSTHIMHLNGT